MKKVDIYVLAGIWTAPNFMEGLCTELTRLYQQDGWLARGTLLFPYGDWYINRMRQLREITNDLLPRTPFVSKTLGGRRAAEAIKSSYRGGRLILIGHSGGGVAGVHAAHILMAEDDIAAPTVVQIGSPKCPIPAALADHVIYVAAVNEQGKWKDPVNRMGSWGEWRSKFRRNSKLLMPLVREVPILGGHADYFRSRNPYIYKNVSNLEVTIDSFWRDIQ
jgi:hypothetical protein